jgi:hypothetical protein
MSRILSGGCVYQFGEHGNRYGLVALPARHRGINDLKNRVMETRQIEGGEIFIFHDFANYKARLAESKIEDASWDCMQEEAKIRPDVDVTQLSWPWGEEHQMPESCLDWPNIDDLMRNEM